VWRRTGTAIDALIPSSVYVACNGIFAFLLLPEWNAWNRSVRLYGIKNPADFFNFVPRSQRIQQRKHPIRRNNKVYQSVTQRIPGRRFLRL